MSIRNPEIQKCFETADDGLQGTIGYFLYTSEAVKCTDKFKLTANLPTGTFKITPDWIRLYNKDQLVVIMDKTSSALIQIQCFISMIAHFEACLSEFIQVLSSQGKFSTNPGNNYKQRLEWAFKIVEGTTFGDPKVLKDLPKYCVVIDHARRIRNLVVHNNGYFNDQYANVINVSGTPSILLPGYTTYLADTTKKIRIQMNDVPFLEYCYCHIRSLHFLHNEIQFQFFGVKEGYSYRDNNKPIEWKRVLPVD